jgi:hypothetical protein
MGTLINGFLWGLGFWWSLGVMYIIKTVIERIVL